VLQGSEVDIKKAVVNRLRKAEIEASLVDVEAINVNRRQERERRELEAELGEDAKEIDETPVGPKELRLIVKGDVSGSVEAVVGALQGIGNGKAVTKIVSSGVGDVSESDVMMAKAVGGKQIFYCGTRATCHYSCNRNSCRLLRLNTQSNRNSSCSEQRPDVFIKHYLQIDGRNQEPPHCITTSHHRKESHRRSDGSTAV
jgi:hypothetical protein